MTIEDSEHRTAHVAQSALLLAPSAGMGGGIERYLATVVDAFDRLGVQYWRENLRPSDDGRIAQHCSVARGATAWLEGQEHPVRIVVGHRALLPVAVWLDRRHSVVSGISVLLHGTDVWGSRWRPEAALLRSSRVRAIAVSAYTAGVLGAGVRATRLSPAFAAPWYEDLIRATKRPQRGSSAVVMTSFRLADWESKGLHTLLHAVEQLPPGINVKICGSGDPPAAVLDMVEKRPWARLLPNLTDEELAAEYASADVFCLATRLQAGRRASGEGFGMVLAEAQLAGTAVIAPAHGGGFDAFVEGLTGWSPVDESPAALALVLGRVLNDHHLRNDIAQQASALARARYEPSRTALSIVERLL